MGDDKARTPEVPHAVAADLQRLAMAAHLTGGVAGAAGAWERAHLAYLATGDVARAVRCAVWLGRALFNRGERAVADGWPAASASSTASAYTR